MAPTKEKGKPSGNTGTHIPAPNTYLLTQLTRANYITARRNPFTETPDAFATELQRHVHFEGNRPPNRRILLFLRLLTYYPPVSDILPELIILIESDNAHVCRLAHYHIRQLAPIRDVDLYRQLLESLERQSAETSPARRACATKTYAKIFHPSEAAHATDFALDVFNKIGGARVLKPIPSKNPSRVAGLTIPDNNNNKPKSKVDTVKDIAKATIAQRKIVRGGRIYDYKLAATPGMDLDNATTSKSKKLNQGIPLLTARSNRSAALQLDDGTGVDIQASTAASATFIKSHNGKTLVGHSVLAALRRINRVATSTARVESYIFDSGLLSIVPSTVRHTVALLELRSTVSPGAVSRYLSPRLPHKSPSSDMRLYLEDLGSRVFFARLLSSLAQDPNLSVYIPDEARLQAKRDNDEKKKRDRPTSIQSALGADTFKGQATGLFKFLFNREQVHNVVSGMRKQTSTALAVITQNGAGGSRAVMPKADDSLGVEFAEALINLVKNASNRVLIEALRGLSKRKWTTWFEAPMPQSALYNAPELKDSEAYGDNDDPWDIDDDDDDAEEADDDSEDENELGAYENDIIGGEDEEGKRASEAKEPDFQDRKELTAANKQSWFSNLNSRRKERREERIETRTPFYLRKVGQGMVPALEIILRRINAGLLDDEPVRRFSAVDAVIVLSRAKIYGHSESDHDTYRKAQGNVDRLRNGSSSRALIVSGAENNNNFSLGSFTEDRHPFQALVKPLGELIDEDPNPFIRGRAAVALLFVIASGAGRSMNGVNDDDDPKSSTSQLSEEAVERLGTTSETPVLLRYFKNYVRHPSTGTGVGLRQMSEVVDYLVYEILDVAPDLSPSAVVLAEEWARSHPTVGVCGRLGSIWEKVLSLGHGAIVGTSLIRSITTCGPELERVASAATIFLRRRTLDVAVLTAGTFVDNLGTGLPEPLPKDVGIEMERYFSVLWHCIMLGPSAECRAFAVDSLGGAAVLAGEPFRIGTYERLVELVRIGGFGVRPVAERILAALDTLYEVRETFSETRAEKGIARGGKHRGKEWLKIVWELRCRAFAAAKIALGVVPPIGWLAIGPGAAADVANAERMFLKEEAFEAGKASGIGADSNGMKEEETAGEAGVDMNQHGSGDPERARTNKTKRGQGISGVSKRNSRPVGPVGPIGPVDNKWIQPSQVGMDDLEDLDVSGIGERHRSRHERQGEWNDDDRERNGGQRYDRRRYDDNNGRGDESYGRRERDREEYYGDDNVENGRGAYRYNDDERRPDDYADRDYEQDGYDRNGNGNGNGNGENAREKRRREKQEEEDRKIARQLQNEEEHGTGTGAGPSSSATGEMFGGDEEGSNNARLGLGGVGMEGLGKQISSTKQAAQRLLKQGMRGGKDLTDKVMKSAARSAALDKFNLSPRSKQ